MAEKRIAAVERLFIRLLQDNRRDEGDTRAMTGGYLELQMGWIMAPILAFRQYVFTDVLPAFGNLGKRAEAAAEEYYSRVGSQPVSDDSEIDMASVAEAAHDKSLSWYQMMASLRQSMLNLVAAGLFHLTEQQLASLCRDAGFTMAPPKDTKLEEVRKWYEEHLRLDLKQLPSWSMIDELRLVANAVKHAEGSATSQLRNRRPELFTSPESAHFYEAHGLEPIVGPVWSPLSGEEFFVRERLLQLYSEAAESLFGEIADHFKLHRREYY